MPYTRSMVLGQFLNTQMKHRIMDTKTKKTLRLDELSDQFDRINEMDYGSKDMFDYNIVAPFSDCWAPKPTRWCKESLATTKRHD